MPLRCQMCFSGVLGAWFCRHSKRNCKWKWLLVLCAPQIAGYLKGGDAIRLLHSHSDSCLTIPSAEQGEELQKSVMQYFDIPKITVHVTNTAVNLTFPLFKFFFPRAIHYETGSISSHARSLWRLEILHVVYVETVYRIILLYNFF